MRADKKRTRGPGATRISRKVKAGLLLLQTQVLDVDSLLLRNAADFGRLLEVLAGAHLTDGTGLLEFALELFERALDVFAFFNGYDDQCFYTSFF